MVLMEGLLYWGYGYKQQMVYGQQLLVFSFGFKGIIVL